MEPKKPAFIPKSWDLPESIRKRLGDAAGRQRLMDEDGHLLFILHQPPQPEDDEVRKPVLIWGQPSGEWKSSPEGGGLAALDAHMESYRKNIHALDEAVEAAKSPRQFFDIMKKVNPLLRATRNLLAVMQEAREARQDERRLINFRDRAVDLERAIDLVASDAKDGMEFALAENTEEQSRFAHAAALEARKLNRLAAFFFPLATLVAVFGINPPSEVMTMPGFWLVIAAGVAAGLVIRMIPTSKS
ncbi:CorA family divalent cation transporter [Luteolibacter flavescens]|uniref:CorA family divalent cation transporter n=1 Tax=Luteolibacter flavescens TaxID=1859460 RepID=A0ABT3FM47_9BACT|nr:CorA family divalent cation transporter [Luteolibacter flavescens]MCW1884331.1 CorA family divalent cation transporter [Luteolibacter flavescens]